MNNMEKTSVRPKISENDKKIQENLISAFEENKCPSCGKDIGLLGIENWNGFCDEDCFQKYKGGDQNLAMAGGEYDYRKSLARDAEKLGMDVNEYKKLREEKKLSFAEIQDGIRNEEQQKMAA
ncbi:MAG: hypothetical protein NTZ13_05180 [Candidatus Parcubacteria bacterium]|nr:hypothetical protein [Candidatus Parcubacteria bacterium]